MRTRDPRHGSAIVEFILAGLASCTLLITTVQLSMAMWHYHTIAYATHEINRYISTHGRSCSQGGNTCTITVGDIATRWKSQAVGIPSSSASLTLTSHSGTVYTCNPVANCLTDGTQWPPMAHLDNAPGRWTTVSSSYTFHSAIVLVWPGWSGRTGSITVPSTSKITMQF